MEFHTIDTKQHSADFSYHLEKTLPFLVKNDGLHVRLFLETVLAYYQTLDHESVRSEVLWEKRREESPALYSSAFRRVGENGPSLMKLTRYSTHVEVAFRTTSVGSCLKIAPKFDEKGAMTIHLDAYFSEKTRKEFQTVITLVQRLYKEKNQADLDAILFAYQKKLIREQRV